MYVATVDMYSRNTMERTQTGTDISKTERHLRKMTHPNWIWTNEGLMN